MKRANGLRRAVRIWLAENDMRQQELADALGIDGATFSRMLHGYRPATDDFAERLKAHTGIDLRHFVEVSA